MISLINITKTYEKGLVKALDKISIEIKQNEIIAITGPSGCGKSTLLNIIGAMDIQDNGEIFYKGRNLSEYKPFEKFRAENIGFVFQFHHLIPTMTLLENIESPMLSLAIPKKQRRQKAMSLLSDIGLMHRANFFPTKVSGGERQRTAIARALANDPEIILADEPTGNLDSETGEKVIEFLLDICKNKGKILIIATHNPEVALKADRIITMRDGKILT